MSYEKPLPDMRPEGTKFWEGTKEHKLLLPTGPDGTPFWYPRAYAPGTLDEVSWTESKGEGTVYTYSIHHIGPSKAYKGDPPHTVVLVDLDEGVEGYLRASDIAKERVDDATQHYAVGDKIEAKFTGLDRRGRILQLSIRAKEDDELADALEEYHNTSIGTTKLGALLKEQLSR